MVSGREAWGRSYRCCGGIHGCILCVPYIERSSNKPRVEGEGNLQTVVVHWSKAYLTRPINKTIPSYSLPILYLSFRTTRLLWFYWPNYLENSVSTSFSISPLASILMLSANWQLTEQLHNITTTDAGYTYPRTLASIRWSPQLVHPWMIAGDAQSRRSCWLDSCQGFWAHFWDPSLAGSWKLGIFSHCL